MRIIYSFFILFLITLTNSSAQTWTVKQQGVTKGFTKRIYFVDANTGYATSSDVVGGFSLIYKTTNGGSNWVSFPTACTNAIYSVTFPNATTGYCCSFNGEISKTTNGGANWVLQYDNPTWDLDAIEFFDANTGFAAGQAIWVKTTNGGTNWVEVSTPAYAGTYSHLINSTTAVYVGYDPSLNGAVFKTTNSGSSFTTYVASPGGANTLYGVYFFDANTGYTGGQGGILARSTNGGVNWSALTYPNTQNIYGMYFFDGATGLVGSSGGFLYKTTNSGSSWTASTFTPSTSQSIYDIHFFNATTGILTGSQGSFYRTTDAGATWNIIAYNTQLNAISFASSTTGIVVGNSSFVQRTTNGGANWTYINMPLATAINLNNVVFPNSLTGYIGGNSGKFFKTTNAGANWDSVTSGGIQTFSSMEFIDANTGYVGSTSGIVKKTINGGVNWTDYNVGASITSNGISFGDVNTGYICSSSGVVRKTTNAGVNWALLTTGTTQALLTVDFADVNTGYAAGNSGTIIKTTNGGTSWTLQTSGITDNINSIKMGSATRGMCAANTGKILVTTDGGTTWGQQTSNVASNIALRGGFIENGVNLFIIGQNGVILNSNDQPLPVELSFFNSSISGRDVKLLWGTVSEVNNSGFAVERKNSNGLWSEIGFVTGNATTNQPHNYSYEDRNLSSGNYSYRLKQIDFNGNFEYKNLSNEVIIGLPRAFALEQNYPNPFNPSTLIKFQLAASGFVTLKVYDVNGREVKQLINELKEAGYYTEQFDAKSLPSGIYFARIDVNNESSVFSKTIKLILAK